MFALPAVSAPVVSAASPSRTLVSPAAAGRVLYAAIGLAMVALMLAAERVYLLDLPYWVYEGAALRAKWLGEAVGAAAIYPVKPYPVPNSAAQVVLALLVGPLGGVGAGKVAAAGVLAACWASFYALCTRLHGETGVWRALVLAATLGASASFWNGYLNFQLGLAVLAWYGAVRARHGLAARPSAVVTAAFGVGLFFCHSVPFAAFALGAGLEALWRRDARLVAAMAPAGLLTLGYVLARGAEVPVSVPFPDFVTAVLYKGYTVLKLGPFVHFVGPTGAGTLDAVPALYAALLALAALVVLALAGLGVRGATRLARASDAESRARLAVVGLAVGLAVLALPIPPVWLSVVNLGERLLAVALLLVVAVVPVPRRAGIGLALACLPFLAHDVTWLAVREAPEASVVEAELERRIALGHERRTGAFDDHLTAHAEGAAQLPWLVRNPYDQVAYYLAVERGVWALPLPSTGLIAGTDP